MRLILTALFIPLSITIFGQAIAKTDSITFCSHNFEIPKDCIIGDKSLNFPNYSVSWKYMDENTFAPNNMSDRERLRFEDNGFLSMLDMLGKIKKKRISCYLLDNKVKGYKITYSNKSDKRCIIYLSGFVDGRAVTLFTDIGKEVNSDVDFPEFLQKMIKFAK